MAKSAPKKSPKKAPKKAAASKAKSKTPVKKKSSAKNTSKSAAKGKKKPAAKGKASKSSKKAPAKGGKSVENLSFADILASQLERIAATHFDVAKVVLAAGSGNASNASLLKMMSGMNNMSGKNDAAIKAVEEAVEEDSEDEDDGLIRKKKKDPNAPKQPMNAYACYIKANYGNMARKNPSWDPKKVMGEMSVSWKTIPDAKKKGFEDQARKSKEVYEVEKKAYNIKQAAALKKWLADGKKKERFWDDHKEA